MHDDSNESKGVSEDTQPRVFRILSISGGGMKGVSSARALAEIEKSLGSLAGHFDLLCGTSTGGLIALALAAGRPAEDVVTFYRDHGPKIFKSSRLGSIKQYITSKHNTRELAEALKGVFGEIRVRDSNSYLCIPAVNTISSTPRVFKTFHHPDLGRDAEMYMCDVALATSAAPFYLPSVRARSGDKGEYLDGGLWANDPTLVGILEACAHFAGPGRPFDAVRVLSVPNVAAPAGLVSKGPRRFGYLRGKAVANLAMDVQEHATRETARLLSSILSHVEIVRLPPLNLSGAQAEVIELDAATPKALDTLEHLGTDLGQRWKRDERIKAFFSTPAAPPAFFGSPS